AEDGIRDFHVTGVQTCALPIFPAGSAGCRHHHILYRGEVGQKVVKLEDEAEMLAAKLRPLRSTCVHEVHAEHLVGAGRGSHQGRSEERRVGKGGGARWGAWEEK